MSKNRIAALGASAASAALVGTVLFAPTAVADQPLGTQPSPSAYAVHTVGLVDIPRTPFVEDGSETLATIGLPKDDPALKVEALKAKAKPGEAKSKIVGLQLGRQAPLMLKADVIKASCVDGKGSISLAKLVIGGQPIDIGSQIPPNSGAQIPSNPLLNVTLNKQVENPDGSLTVTAVHIELLNAAKDVGLNQTIDLASATCAKQDGGETTPPTTPPEDGDDGDGDNGGDNGDGDGDKDNGGDNGADNGDGADEADEDGTAPTPVPQPGHISVTG